MSGTIFARAIPSKIAVTETYSYHANIHGNPTIEEKGTPQGEITIEIPYDGYKHLNRFAYADIWKQHQESSGNPDITLGYLAASGISSQEFWSSETDSLTRKVLRLEIPAPGEKANLGIFIEDCYSAFLKHTYVPNWPDVSPRARPIKLDIDLYDEFSIGNHFDEILQSKDWDLITEDRSFQRSLFFDFDLELALPENTRNRRYPVARLMRLEWPVATSYHMLQLHLVPEKGEKPKDYELFYNPEKGSVEWLNLPFKPGSLTTASETIKQLRLFHTQRMLLDVNEPGELYSKDTPLICRLEIEIPNILLSGLEIDYFDSTGNPEVKENAPKIETQSLIYVDIEIDLEQRFFRRILSPLYQIQFEGLILEEERMRDITNLLKELGFVSPRFEPIPDQSHRRKYGLIATKEEGSDQMFLWIRATGSLTRTERETVIPGGKSFKTQVDSGNTELCLRAEMRGDVRKLAQILNKIHTSLKERFRYLVTLD